MTANDQDHLLKLTERYGVPEVLRVLAVITNGLGLSRLFKKLDKVYTEVTNTKDVK